MLRFGPEWLHPDGAGFAKGAGILWAHFRYCFIAHILCQVTTGPDNLSRFGIHDKTAAGGLEPECGSRRPAEWEIGYQVQMRPAGFGVLPTPLILERGVHAPRSWPESVKASSQVTICLLHVRRSRI